MAPERWRRVNSLFHMALEREPGQREAFLRRACEGDASLLEEVRSLLARESLGEDIFASPAMDVAACALAREKPARPHAGLAGRSLLHYRILCLLYTSDAADE